jgi:predicted ATPase/class 3 adenylate cyclase
VLPPLAKFGRTRHSPGVHALPDGTVTFVFTDVAGSTKLLDALGPGEYAAVLAEERRVVRSTFAAGVEVDTQGDAFFYAFARAADAVAACEAAVQRLVGSPIRIRVGVHTGEPLLTEEGYVGMDVHRAARIAAAAHGGQVVVSRTTRDLVPELELLDLGEHRLKDLGRAERLYQLGRGEFPPLRSLHRTNLPMPATPFVGREQELGEVLSLLTKTRLLTLTGAGGTGKTRLGLQAAAEASGGFPDGVFWVPLAPLRDPELVLETAGQALGAKEGLPGHIADKSILLLLDNFEHVIEAADGLVELLTACPHVQLLVTSRELLRLPGEQAYPVPPLQPEEGRELFVARARAAEPGFVDTPTVTELCERLEQLPLALELAAAWVRVLSPEQLLERLSQRLDLLQGGRGLDPRQQTLRATIEWSYDLLDADERKLFARLAVFAGSCTLEDAEAVCGADVNTLASLIDKSLVRHIHERFFMLEAIRDYANELLDAGEANEWRRLHAEHFLAIAERAESELRGERQGSWLDALEPAALEPAYPNLRAALAWFMESGPPDSALRLAATLRPFWVWRGYLREGRAWIERALAADDERTATRAKALATAGLLAALQGDWPATKRWSAAALELSEELAEPGFAASSLLTLGRATLAKGDPDRAVKFFREGERYALEAGDTQTLAMAAFNLGYAALASNDLRRARQQFELALERSGGDPYRAARSLAALGSVALHEERLDDALAQLRRSLSISGSRGDRDNAAWALELLGGALAESQPQRAVRVLAAAEALREELGTTLDGPELALHTRALATLDSLEPQARAEAWAAGREFTFDQAVADALNADSP